MGCPTAADEEQYGLASARAAAAWVVWTLHRRLSLVSRDAGALDRTVATLAVAPGLAAEPALYPAFGGLAWPDEGRVGR